MADKDAKITIGADASAMERVKAAAVAGWRDFSSSISEAFGRASTSIISDLGNIATAQGRVNFSAQHDQVRSFEGVTARLAVSSGRDFESMRSGIEGIGTALGKRPSEVAAWTASVGALTYSYEGAAAGLRGIEGLAAATGRRAEDFRGLAVELQTVGHVTGDTTHAIGVLASQSKELGTQGGIAAFAQQVQGLQGVISLLAVNSEKDFLRVTALAGALGKGFAPDAAARVQQSALGTIASDPVGWSRYLGRRVDDEFGHVKDPTKVLRDITEKVKRTYGSDARRVLQLNFGAETGAALYRADFTAAAKAAGLAPSAAPETARAALQGSDAGKRQAAEAQLEVSSRNLLGSSTALGRAADAMQRFAAGNPITSTVVSTALGTGLSSFLGKFGSSLFGKAAGLAGGAGANAAGAGAGVLGGGVAGTVGTAGALAAAGVAGAVVGAGAFELADRAAGGRITGAGSRFFVDREAIAAGEADLARSRARVQLAQLGRTSTGDVQAGAQAARQLLINHGQAGFAALAGGGQGQLAALIAELRREGKGEADAQRIAQAVSAALKQLKIINATGGPVDLVEQGGSSAAAGSQAHP